MKKRLALITAIVLAGCLQLQADSVVIVNPSAEANTGAAPTGWTVLAGAPIAQTAAARGMAADDGLNLFMLFNPAAIKQTLGETYQSGSTYTMSVDVAKRSDLAAGQVTGWGFGLYYDNGGTLTEIAKTQGVATWANGTWQQKDLVLTVNAGAAYIGKAIVVKLFGNPTSSTTDYLDNVRLSRGAVLPPETLTLSPANGATYVATNVNLVATFNMDIVAGNGNILITNLTDGTATTFAVGDAQVTISGATLTIDPDDDLIVNKDYAVLIETGAIENTFGGGFGITDTVTWRFTTKQLPAGSVAIVNPSAESNTGAAPTGWTVLAGTPTAQTAASRPIAADDGLNLFMFYDSALSQTLGSTYQSGYTYTMSVDVAKRFETTGWGFGLYYDNGGTLTEVAKTVGTATWTVGTWRQVDLDLTVNAGAAYIGKAIVVKLFWAGGAYSTTSDYLDNVRLGGGLTPPVVIGAPETRAIYQRGTNNTASLSVTGTCLAGLDRIEVRALTRSGYKGTDMDWTTLVTSPGTSFSNTVELAGGWYDIEVRAISNGVSIATSRVDRVGIGDIFITCGQSNSANYGGPLQTPTDDRVNAFDFFMWQLAIDPQPNAGGTNGSAWPDFGSMLATRTEVPVAIIALGVGGTSVSQWLPGGYYSKILTAMNAVKPYGGFRAILWHQGETDSLLGTSAETYADRLKTIIAQSRTDAGFNVPWGVALASWHPNPSSSAINQAKVIAGQQLVIANDANVFKGAETDSFHTNGWLNDTVHFNDAGLRDHGRQWVDSVCSALLSDDRDNDGMSDLWMLMHFGHATGSAEDNSRAIDDADNDGVSNLDEYRATTDPKNRDVLLKLDRIELLTNATIRITWPAVAGRTYRVLSTEDLVSPLAWDISTPLHSYGSSMDYEETLTSMSARFFRVQAE